MNERIKQLAIEAGYEKNTFGVGYWDNPMEKFAQLIVRECATVADHWVMFDEGPLTYGPVGETIRKHFGVKHD